MTQITTSCDRCLRRCDCSVAMLALKPAGARDFKDFDVCPSCHADLLAWLLTGPAGSGPAAIDGTIHDYA